MCDHRHHDKQIAMSQSVSDSDSILDPGLKKGMGNVNHELV